MDKAPLVSVIILSWNRKEQLRETLERVLTLTYDPYEVIVVDNGSVDGCQELVRTMFPGALLLPLDKNVGIAGWNEGAGKAKGEYFLFLDDDAFILGKTLECLIAIAQEAHIDLLSFPIAHPDRPGVNSSEIYPTGLLSFWGCAVLISRKCFEGTAGFEPRIFVYAHELDFSIRAIGRGFRLGYTRTAWGYHSNEGIEILTRRRGYYNTRNLMWIASRYFSGTRRIRAMSVQSLNALWLSVRSPQVLPWLVFGSVSGFLLGLTGPRFRISKALQDHYLKNFIEFTPFVLLFINRRLLGRMRKGYFLQRKQLYPEFDEGLLWSSISVDEQRVNVQTRGSV